MGATARSDGKVVRLAHTGSDGRLDRCWTSYGTKCPNPDPGGKGRFEVEEGSCFPLEVTSSCPGAASRVSPYGSISALFYTFNLCYAYEMK